MLDRIILVTKKTELTELVERFGTVDQARFFVESAGGNFAAYEDAHRKYETAADRLRNAVPSGIRFAEIERTFVPTYLFHPEAVVVTLGQDGLVANVAKYLEAQPILAFTPEYGRVGGVLARLSTEGAERNIRSALGQSMPAKLLTMAEVTLNDGQRLLAANDLFIGPRSHISARYRIRFGNVQEEQSSSGIIVSTGVGSSGWYRSVITGAFGVTHDVEGARSGPPTQDQWQWSWDADELRFSVREPFPSVITQASLVHGVITKGSPLMLESLMPQNGVIFSDGIESDFIEFNAGATARVGLCPRKAKLLG